MALISIKKRLHPSSNEMAELFQRNKSTISRHISKIYEEGGLSPTGTVSEFATVQMKGTRSVERKIIPQTHETLSTMMVGRVFSIFTNGKLSII